MGFKKGLDANRKLPPEAKYTAVERELYRDIKKLKDEFQIGRVTDIILNDKYPDIENYGGVNGIGTIKFELNNFIQEGGGIARPFFPQMSSYPLVNEMVLIFKLPTRKIGVNTNEEGYYYINMINLWNNPHHNAYPNPVTNNIPPEMGKNYQEVEAGSTKRVPKKQRKINLNSPVNTSQQTFVERSNISPLLPFAGDIIHQGRWGNTIRLGSTAKPFSGNAINNWSEVGANGDPLIILRNGQNPQSKISGYVPTTENINSDQSSIYLTSTQKIKISQPSFQNFLSYSDAPDSIDTFEDPQVIINSDRLVFNAKKDHILLSAEKSVGLSSGQSLNFDSKKFVIHSKEIRLGSNSATESVVKGDTLYNDLYHMLTGLIQVVKTLEDAQMWPGGAPTTDAGTSTVAAITSHTLTTRRDNLKKILSTKVKTL